LALLPVTATRAPSAKNCFAVSRPMPLVPPVTNARLPCNLLMFDPQFSKRAARLAGAVNMTWRQGQDKRHASGITLAKQIALIARSPHANPALARRVAVLSAEVQRVRLWNSGHDEPFGLPRPQWM
jgi:hypothetical protein